MCYAIPGKIISQEDNIAIIDYFGEERKVMNEFEEIGIGDYVYAQGGIVLVKVPEEEAKETLLFWKDKFSELKEIDKDISKVEEIKASDNLIEILQKVNHRKELSKEDVSFLLGLKDPQELKLLFEFANNLRQKEHDNACCVHGILEFSNYCQHNCMYCGIRNSADIARYRMTEEEIFEAVKKNVDELGFRGIVIQSGEDPWYTEERLASIVKSLRKLGILIFLSIGIRSKETYDKLYEAGARAILLRFETSNDEIFERMRPGTNLQERLDLIKWLKERGYLVATGFLVGLPGEKKEDIVNNVFLMKELGVEMYSFGPFIPCEKTPLGDEGLVDKNLMLKIISICRLIDFKSKILVTSALETLNALARKQGLMAGANSLMINTTPKSFKDAYELYPGRPDKDKDIALNIKETVDLLYSIGRAPTDLGL
jgi:biotin synthase